MKVMKLALLGTAALAAVSVSARADNLSDLKAQIEALNARVATLEATPSVPAGYSMIAMSKGDQIVQPGYVGPNRDNYKGPVHVISIMPTADAPAPTTQITWTGYVRAAVVFDHYGYTGGGSYDNVDVKARAYLTVVGTTDTAVGEVGAKINLKADLGGNQLGKSYGLFGGDASFVTDGFSGWWKMTPNFTLEGGDGDSLSYNSHSFDALCNCFYGTDIHMGSVGNNPFSGYAFGAYPNYTSTFDTKVAHLRLAYADGPIAAAIQVEDAMNSGNNYTGQNGALGVSGQISWSGDTFSLQATGGYWGNPNNYVYNSSISSTGQDAYSFSVGAGAKFGMISVDAAVGWQRGFDAYSDATIASGIVQANLSDSFLAQLGATHIWYTNQYSTYNNDATEVDLGLYYTPVKQLTLGLEGEATFYDDPANSYNEYDTSYRAAFTSVFRF